MHGRYGAGKTKIPRYSRDEVHGRTKQKARHIGQAANREKPQRPGQSWKIGLFQNSEIKIENSRFGSLETELEEQERDLKQGETTYKEESFQ